MEQVLRKNRIVVSYPPAGGNEANFSEIFRGAAGIQARPVKYPTQKVGFARWVAAHAERLAASLEGSAPILLGASLGAMAALDSALYLEACGLPVGGVVVVSSVAPQLRPGPVVRHWSDEALLDFVRAGNGGGLPDSFESLAVRAYAIATLRRDLTWADAYAGPRYRQLSCPLTVVRGGNDALVPAIAGTYDWAPWTTGRLTVHTVPGGSHLFFTEPCGAAAVRGVMTDMLTSEGQ